MLTELLKSTRAVQPVATCRQSPYLHKPAIVIVTSFSLWRLAPTALAVLAAPVLIMMSISLWRHLLLSWPHPPFPMYVTDTLLRLIYRDIIAFSKQRYDINCEKCYVHFAELYQMFVWLSV